MKDPRNKIDEALLLRLGFYIAPKQSPAGRHIFRIKIPYYSHEIEVQLGNYPISNPNCGVVSLYMPPCEASGVPRDLIKKKTPWTKADYKRASEHTIKFKAQTIPIAWYVHTPERLRTIIVSLTAQNV